MFEIKQACDPQTGQNCSIYLQSEPSGGECARATAHAALLFLLSLSPAASCTSQTARKRQQWYLFVCFLVAEGVEMSRPLMGAFWMALPGSHQVGRNDPGNETHGRMWSISCTGASNTYCCELERLNWPNYGKWIQVIFVKTEIIDDSLVSDPLIIWDPSKKLWKGRLASAAHSLSL